MADRAAKKLARIHRVRTLQLNLVQADEVAARHKVVQEEQLRDRIAQLAANVAPTPVQQCATSFAAAAHYRERLHQSAHAAENRVSQAELGLDRARVATQEAKRDQSAVEKLIARAHARALVREMRALEDLPASARKNRHDPC